MYSLQVNNSGSGYLKYSEEEDRFLLTALHIQCCSAPLQLCHDLRSHDAYYPFLAALSEAY